MLHVGSRYISSPCPVEPTASTFPHQTSHSHSLVSTFAKMNYPFGQATRFPGGHRGGHRHCVHLQICGICGGIHFDGSQGVPTIIDRFGGISWGGRRPGGYPPFGGRWGGRLGGHHGEMGAANTGGAPAGGTKSGGPSNSVPENPRIGQIIIDNGASDPAVADEKLRKLATLMKEIMEEFDLRIVSLGEVKQHEEREMWGQNKNVNGDESQRRIELNLRKAPWWQVVDTMLHELAHNRYRPHDISFYRFWNRLRSAYERLRGADFLRPGAHGRAFDDEDMPALPAQLPDIKCGSGHAAANNTGAAPVPGASQQEPKPPVLHRADKANSSAPLAETPKLGCGSRRSGPGHAAKAPARSETQHASRTQRDPRVASLQDKCPQCGRERIRCRCRGIYY